MKNLLIIVATAFGREVYYLATQCKGYLEEFKIKGFLDDRTNALDGYKGYPPIISSVEDYQVQPDDIFVCALGNSIYKKHYVEIILAKGGQFISLIHPSVNIHSNAEIGNGCVIKSRVNICCDTKIGNFVSIYSNTVVGHDAVIGDWCHLETNSFIGGGAQLSPFSTIHTGGIIFPEIKIGENAIVGAGSVVLSNVKENSTVFGNPARCIKF